MMKKIIIKTEPENDLTIFTVIGKVEKNDIKDAICDFYENSVTANVLWDLSKSDLSEIKSSDVKRIADLSNVYADKRPFGKTAIVSSDDLIFGLSRMYELNKDEDNLPFKTRTFRDIDKAYKWLLSS
ncbi:MAG: hypothetical protein GY699_18150 [Desulfobacteraceae bacterium]|nr:hypothetical protein [Desulfobacteraceae bacterium]